MAGPPPCCFGGAPKVSGEVPAGVRAFRIRYARTESRECGGFAFLVICKVSLARERCPFKSIVSRGPLAIRLCTMSAKTHEPTVPRCGRTREELRRRRRALDEHLRTTLGTRSA